MDGVAKALPALLRAEKLQKRAARDGFDWGNTEGPTAKVHEEIAELAEASQDEKLEEAGDLLFAAVNLVRAYGVPAEEALRAANDKFERRYRGMEAEAQGTFATLDLEAQERLWQQVKSKEEAELLKAFRTARFPWGSDVRQCAASVRSSSASPSSSSSTSPCACNHAMRCPSLAGIWNSRVTAFAVSSAPSLLNQRLHSLPRDCRHHFDFGAFGGNSRQRVGAVFIEKIDLVPDFQNRDRADAVILGRSRQDRSARRAPVSSALRSTDWRYRAHAGSGRPPLLPPASHGTRQRAAVGRSEINPDRIGQNCLFDTRKRNRPHCRIERREKQVFGHHLFTRQVVEERRFSGVRVTDECNHRPRRTSTPVAVQECGSCGPVPVRGAGGPCAGGSSACRPRSGFRPGRRESRSHHAAAQGGSSCEQDGFAGNPDAPVRPASGLLPSPPVRRKFRGSNRFGR